MFSSSPFLLISHLRICKHFLGLSFAFFLLLVLQIIFLDLILERDQFWVFRFTLIFCFSTCVVPEILVEVYGVEPAESAVFNRDSTGINRSFNICNFNVL